MTRENGFYWVSPMSGLMTIAHYHSGERTVGGEKPGWLLPGVPGRFAETQCLVLSARIPLPAEVVAERIVDVVLRTVEAVPMEGDNAALEYDRDQLVARITEVLQDVDPAWQMEKMTDRLRKMEGPHG